MLLLKQCSYIVLYWFTLWQECNVSVWFVSCHHAQCR